MLEKKISRPLYVYKVLLKFEIWVLILCVYTYTDICMRLSVYSTWGALRPGWFKHGSIKRNK